MHKTTLFTIAFIFAFLAGPMDRACAQTVDKAYGKSLILAGGGTSTTNTLTLTPSASQASSVSITLPMNNVLGPLTNDGSGNLNWGGPTGVSAGSANQFLTTNNNASKVVAWQTFTTNATLQGNAISSALGIALGNANTWTVAQTMQRNSIGTTSTDAIELTNAAAATSTVQQRSPRLNLTGQGWKTNTTAGSQPVSWIVQNIPSAGTTNPISHLDFQNSINGTFSTAGFDLFSGGGATLGVANPSNPGAGVFNAATGFEVGGTSTMGKMLIGNGTDYVPTTYSYPTTVGGAGNILWSNGSGFFSDSVTTAQYSTAQLGNPTGTTSATGVMMGLGSGSTPATFTPHGSGIVLILITGNMQLPQGYPTADGYSVSAQIRYADASSITAPTNGASPVGTAAGSNNTTVMANGANQWFFSLNAIVGGGGSPLTVGHTYWIDVDVASPTGGGTIQAAINNVTISSVELE